MKTFTQFLEQKINEQMDMPPAQPPAMVAPADNQLDKQKQLDKQEEEKYLASIRKQVEAGIGPKQEVYDVINYLSASSTSLKDLKELGTRIYDLSALNKIKLKFYGYDGGVSFEWFDKNKGEFVKTRTMNTFDTFQRFKTLLDDLFPLPPLTTGETGVEPVENDKSSNKKIEIPDIKKYLPNRSN
jgi:hypothetical protein